MAARFLIACVLGELDSYLILIVINWSQYLPLSMFNDVMFNDVRFMLWCLSMLIFPETSLKQS